MSRLRLVAATTLAMIAFAGNSLLCRLALKETDIDAATFTSVRLIFGALMLWLIVYARDRAMTFKGNAPSALMLFVYAVCFSFAYVQLSAATGALLLFGAVQATMIGYGISHGERLRPLSIAGMVASFAGLILLVLPGVAAPPILGTALMIAAGIAWGIYSLRGKKIAGDPTRVTAGNFILCVPLAIVLSLCAPALDLDRWHRDLLRDGIWRAHLRRGLRDLVYGTSEIAGDAGRDRSTERTAYRRGRRNPVARRSDDNPISHRRHRHSRRDRDGDRRKIPRPLERKTPGLTGRFSCRYVDSLSCRIPCREPHDCHRISPRLPSCTNPLWSCRTTGHPSSDKPWTKR